MYVITNRFFFSHHDVSLTIYRESEISFTRCFTFSTFVTVLESISLTFLKTLQSLLAQSKFRV